MSPTTDTTRQALCAPTSPIMNSALAEPFNRGASAPLRETCSFSSYSSLPHEIHDRDSATYFIGAFILIPKEFILRETNHPIPAREFIHPSVPQELIHSSSHPSRSESS